MNLITIYLLSIVFAFEFNPDEYNIEPPLTEAIPPKEDPFYIPPSNLSKYQNGHIIKLRETTKLRNLIFPIKIQSSWQFMVSSRNSLDDPTVVIVSLLIPFNANFKKILSFQTFEDSPSLNCAPSYGLLKGSNLKATPLDTNFILSGLKNGWIVIVPDYESNLSSFGIGLTAGKSVLDSIKAILSLQCFPRFPRVVLWGYSGGAYASVWAASILSSYSPELSKYIVGVAAGGTPTNFTNIFIDTDETMNSALIPLTLLGIGNERPEFIEYLRSQVQDPKKMYLIEQKLCLIDARLKLANVNYFNDGVFESIHVLDGVRDILNQQDLLYVARKFIPTNIPILFYHYMFDDETRFNDVLELFKIWCEYDDVNIQLSVDTLSGSHIGQAILGSPLAFSWLRDRLNGKELTNDNCVLIEKKSNLMYPGVTKGIINLLGGIGKSILKLKLGPREKLKKKLKKKLSATDKENDELDLEQIDKLLLNEKDAFYANMTNQTIFDLVMR
ncbi:unnamed protein product [Candida verbasci]|uniref:Triacylglycerol lipase n=1 Tax=Candida verbasci TaxID=1227364 RepID=A0A9W4TTR6_9ASCO|nr:unnamed protein product [Candida verbasci]